jgi:hypothetical protein
LRPFPPEPAMTFFRIAVAACALAAAIARRAKMQAD